MMKRLNTLTDGRRHLDQYFPRPRPLRPHFRALLHRRRRCLLRHPFLFGSRCRFDAFVLFLMAFLILKNKIFFNHSQRSIYIIH